MVDRRRLELRRALRHTPATSEDETKATLVVSKLLLA